MKFKKWVWVGVAVLFMASAAMAQDGAQVLPSIYAVIFSAAMYQAIGAVVGFTQLVNNMTKWDGWKAVVLAVTVAMVYTFVMYFSQGIWWCVAVGVASAVAAALSFKATTTIGHKLG